MSLCLLSRATSSSSHRENNLFLATHDNPLETPWASCATKKLHHQCSAAGGAFKPSSGLIQSISQKIRSMAQFKCKGHFRLSRTYAAFYHECSLRKHRDIAFKYQLAPSSTIRIQSSYTLYVIHTQPSKILSPKGLPLNLRANGVNNYQAAFIFVWDHLYKEGKYVFFL